MRNQADFNFDEDKQPLSPPKTGAQLADSRLGASVKDEPQPVELKREQDPKKLLDKFDPESIHYNYFYVAVSGHIESGQFPFLDGLSCKHSLVYGKDWQLADVHYALRLVGYRNGHFAALF